MYGKILLVMIWMLESASSKWVLTPSPINVTPQITPAFSITCKYVSSSTLVTVDKISIRQYDKPKYEWKNVAWLTADKTGGRTSLNEAKVTGQLGTPASTYITMFFDVATTDCIGRFACDVSGVDANNKKITITDTQHAIVFSKTTVKIPDADLIKLVKYLVNSVSVLSKNTKTITSQINTVTTEQKQIENALLKVISDTTANQNNIQSFTDQVNKINSGIASLVEEHNNLAGSVYALEQTLTWPVGKFSLPKPDTGCSDYFKTTWGNSSVTVSTNPGSGNRNSGSSPLNLAGNVFHQDNISNYVTVEMCSKLSDTDGLNRQGPVWPTSFYWPKGTYCIQSYTRSNCPLGFEYGDVRYGRYNNGQIDQVTNLPGYDRFNTEDRTYIFYCCRNDGDSSIPIALPPQYPFYLYRFGPICQKVAGMDVSNQWILVDTGKGNMTNSYYNDNHPDGDIKSGVRTQLCYYSPQAYVP